MTTRKLDDEFDTVRSDLTKLRGDISNLSTALKDVTSETVQEQLDLVRARIDGLTGEAKLQGRRSLDDLTDHIEEKPLASILIALGVGFVIGRLLDR